MESSDAKREPKTAPCQLACPAGINVPSYLRHIAEGDFEGALAVILEKIPFPAVCGYACVHPCEAKCARQQIDEPLAIRLLKRTAVQIGGQSTKAGGFLSTSTGKKVAVVGAGPCGLTAAYYLAMKGHGVSVFEALPQAGGMMRYGIPGYRLPRDVLDHEVAGVTAMGVEMKTGHRVESAEELLSEGFQAVLVAIGAWSGVRLGIAGEDSVHDMDGLHFLNEVNAGRAMDIGDRVVVVGGGNTAIDAARTAARLGARDVTVVYRRTRAEMPASIEEVDQALEEGIRIEFLTAPVRISEDGCACRLVCQRMKLGRVDASGRPEAVAVGGSEFVMDCDSLIVAVGQKAGGGNALLVNNDGAIKVNPQTLETPIKAIYAAGDAVSGPASVIKAIAHGRRAAVAIDEFLGGDGIIDQKLAADATAAEWTLRPGLRRPFVPTIPLRERLNSFAPVELGYDGHTASFEARRCLGCDVRDYAVVVDGEACKACGYCVEACTLGVFAPTDYFNERGYKPVAAAHTESCIGCNSCFYVCPDFAISIRREESRRGSAC